MVKDVALHLDKAAAGAGHLILVFGKKLTQSRATYLVASWHREMFAFELTARQARHLGAEPNALGALVRRAPPGGKLIVPDEPAVLLTDLHIDHQDSQQPTAPVTGHVTYQSSLSLLDGITVRMMFDLPGGSTVSHYHHPMGPLAGSGTLRFKLTPLVNDMVKQSRDMPRTLPVFISFCRQEPGRNAPDIQISNTCAALIDLA